MTGEVRSARQDRSGGAVVVFALLLCLGCPLLYCASVGPIIWLVNHDVMAPGPAKVFFAPLNWLYENVPALQPLFDVYIDLWDD